MERDKILRGSIEKRGEMAAKECEFKILENRLIARDVFLLRLDGDCSSFSGAGQFCEIRIPGKYLRRPISVCDITENTLTLIYKVLGEGTEELSFMEEGEYLPVLTGLGNGYDLSACPNNPVLAGGGVGVPPLYFLCKKLIEAGKHPYVALGFRSKEDVFFLEEFRALGVPVNLITEDGSAGQKGFVTSILGDHRYAFSCGPEAMLRAVYEKVEDGQFSFEERMGCGFGACMGCSRKMRSGMKRICTDGPVFPWKEIVW